MKTKILEMNQGGIQEIVKDEFDVDNLHDQSVYVYQIISENFSEIIKELIPFRIDKHILNALNEPEKHTRFRLRDETVYGQLAVFSPEEKKDIVYTGMLIKSNILFTIQLQEGEVLHDILDTILIYSPEQRTDLSQLLYIVIDEFLSTQAEMGVALREKVDNLSKNLDKGISAIKPDDIMKLKSNLADFTNVLEQQYLTFNFPPKKVLHDDDHTYKFTFLELLKSLEILRSSLNQTERRLDSVHNHYLLLLQEKSNKRINILTIVQAVFVPLTVIVGVYGMNFSFMPELQWTYSYFVCLGLMVLLVLIEIRYFYKHGWFD